MGRVRNLSFVGKFPRIVCRPNVAAVLIVFCCFFLLHIKNLTTASASLKKGKFVPPSSLTNIGQPPTSLMPLGQPPASPLKRATPLFERIKREIK